MKAIGKHIGGVATAAGVVLFSCLAVAQDTAAPGTLSAEQIVARANRVAYYQGADGQSEVNMEITDKDGRTQARRFVILRRNDEPPAGSDAAEAAGGQKFFVYFMRPADWNRTVFMVHKRLDRDDDRWLYMPGLDLVRRIAASDKRTSFVGSHFFYEDVSGRNPAEDNHALERETADTYVIRSTPKDPGTVEFAHYLVYIHKETFLPYAAEFFDTRGDMYRSGRALATEVIQGYVTVTRNEMSDLRNGGKTVVTYSRVRYDVGLPEDIFTEQYLRNPPRRYLR